MSDLPPALDYRSLFHASPHPCLVLDPKGRVLAANRAYLAGVGLSRGCSADNLVGRHLRDVMPDAADRIAPIQESIARAIATGRSDTVEGGAQEPSWSVTHVPVHDAAGAVTAVLHHPAEQPGPSRAVPETALAVQEDRQRREQIFQQMPGFVAVLHGPAHVFQYVNDAYVTIAGARDFLGRSVREVFPELAEQGFYELLDTVYRTGKPFAARAMPIRLSGDSAERAIDLLYQPLRDESGAVTGIFVADTTSPSRSVRRRRSATARSATAPCSRASMSGSASWR